MRVLLPRRSDVIAMAEQAFVAVNEFRNRLADVIAAPGFRINRLLLRLGLGLILPARSVDRQGEERQRANNQQLRPLGAQSLGAQAFQPASFHQMSIHFQLSASAIGRQVYLRSLGLLFRLYYRALDRFSLQR